MPSTYSPDLRIQLMANGENTGSWGTITNSNLGTILEDAISGLVTVPVISSAQALTIQDGAADEARCAAVNLTTSTSANFSVFVPPVTKLYVFINSSLYTATVYASSVAGNTTPAGTGVAIPAGKTVLLRCTGINIVEQVDFIVGNFGVGGNLSVGGNASVGGNHTVAGNETVSGDLTVSQSVTALDSAFLGTSQIASISVGAPTTITVTRAPASGAAVTFSSTDTLPTGITAGTTYFAIKVSSTTFNISVSPTLTPLVGVSAPGIGTHSVLAVSLSVTPPAASNNTQLATTEFVKTAAVGGGTLTAAQNYATPVTLASATSVAIGAAASNVVNISGTTTITSFDTIAAGAVRLINFTDAMLLTYNATSLILPGNANITTAAGDSAVFESLGSGNWKCIQYTRALQSPFISPIPNAVVRTTTGTFTVPTGVSRLKVRLVAGGGGGGSGTLNIGGGGGGGGVEAWLSVTAGLVLTVTIGAGGAINGTGGNSTITGTGVSITVTGGAPGNGSYNGGAGGGLSAFTVPVGSTGIAYKGQSGQSGAANTSGIGAGIPTGGSSMLGGGGNAAGYGAGGSGWSNGGSTAGGGGACIIEY